MTDMLPTLAALIVAPILAALAYVASRDFIARHARALLTRARAFFI